MSKATAPAAPKRKRQKGHTAYGPWHCERCQHGPWVARSPEYPKVCPRCKTPYWDTPREA